MKCPSRLVLRDGKGFKEIVLGSSVFYEKSFQYSRLFQGGSSAGFSFVLISPSFSPLKYLGRERYRMYCCLIHFKVTLSYETLCWKVALSFCFLSLRVGTSANSEEVPYLKLQSFLKFGPFRFALL